MFNLADRLVESYVQGGKLDLQNRFLQREIIIINQNKAKTSKLHVLQDKL